jgi:hypothetical protein
MSKSPLSGAFAGSSEPAKKNKKNGALLLISGIALATSIGGVFASNTITINNGAAIQFGQGVAATNSCEDALTTSMAQVFNNDDDLFYVGEVTVAGINAGCVGKTLVVSLLDSAGEPLHFYNITGTANVTQDIEDLALEEISAGLVAKLTVTTQ